MKRKDNNKGRKIWARGIRRLTAVGCVATLSMSILAGMVTADFTYAEETDTDTVSVIFTHDMHSHLDADKAEKDGKLVEVGGFARLKTAMEAVKAEYTDSFVLDAGDFSMGTPYQTVFSQEAVELKMMKHLEFDAAALGNHEFDYRALGLASMLDAAEGSGIPLVISNIDWKATLADETLAEDAEKLKAACDAYGVEDYLILERGGVRAAVFGLMGENAVEYAPESGLLFKDAAESAADTVERIKSNADADIIICLSHCGTIENEADVMEETEDYLLAKAVPDIDLIISGHSHTMLEEPVQVGDTCIVSCGAYNANMGHVVLERDDGEAGEDVRYGARNRYKMTSYELIPLDETVAGDPAVDTELDKYRKLVNERYFDAYGYSAGQVIVTNDIDFTPVDQLGIAQGEEPLGNLITDSYKYALEQAGDSADIAIVPLGVIRGSFFKGDITVADAFNVSSLGYGKDGLSGYPLVKAYLTGKELKAVAEVDASVSNLMGVARLYSSGLEYSWNPNRLIMNRAVDVRFRDAEGELHELEDDRLYSVVADLYSCQMLGTVKDQSFGLLKIEPKDENGELITDYEEHIIYDGDKELKAWYALASYIDSFEGDEVPAEYGQLQSRKIEIDSWSPVEILKQPNKIFWLLATVAVVLMLVVVGIVVLVRKIRKKAKRRK